MKIWKIVYAWGHQWAAWILPNGQIVSLYDISPLMSHLKYIRENLGKFGLTEDDAKNSAKIYNKAIQKGAIRLAIFMNELSIVGKKHNIGKNAEYIYRIFKERGVRRMIYQEFDGGETREITPIDLFNM